EPRTAAGPAGCAVAGVIYQFHHTYGSPTVDQQTQRVRRVQLSEGGLRARIEVEGLRLGYVHEIAMTGVRSAEGAPLLHDTGYFTLNRIPAGAPMPADQSGAEGGTGGMSGGGSPAAAPTAEATAVPVSKRMLTPPASWNGQIDRTITIRTEPGLRFDLPEVVVGAGERVRLLFVNGDDMLHNL